MNNTPKHTIFQLIAKQHGVSPKHVRAEIQKAIDAAWNDPQGRAEQQRLFPEGKPSPELFITRLAEQVKKEQKAPF